MLVKFTQDRILLSGQRVNAGELVEVSDEDGKAFISNMVAVAAPTPPKKKEE